MENGAPGGQGAKQQANTETDHRGIPFSRLQDNTSSHHESSNIYEIHFHPYYKWNVKTTDFVQEIIRLIFIDNLYFREYC